MALKLWWKTYTGAACSWGAPEFCWALPHRTAASCAVRCKAGLGTAQLTLCSAGLSCSFQTGPPGRVAAVKSCTTSRVGSRLSARWEDVPASGCLPQPAGEKHRQWVLGEPQRKACCEQVSCGPCLLVGGNSPLSFKCSGSHIVLTLLSCPTCPHSTGKGLAGLTLFVAEGFLLRRSVTAFTACTTSSCTFLHWVLLRL